MVWKIGGFGNMPICLTCGHQFTLYMDQNTPEFFIEECWCGGYLISRNLIRDILNAQKSLNKTLHLLQLVNKLDKNQEQEMINYAITKKLLDEKLQLRVYLNRNKKIYNPLEFLIKIVEYVLED
jgi:hypothetical protein